MPKKSREEWKVYKNVFDNATLRNIHKLSNQGHFEELKSPVALGKESNVFTAVKGRHWIIAKIYRVENCNFNKMYEYIAPDPRYAGIKKRRRLVIFSWVQREYRNLLKAREVMKVPAPIAVKDNVLLMKLIGCRIPAPMLKDSEMNNPRVFFEKVLDNVKKLYKAGLVHADLSEFNILNHEQEPVFIDWSQATTTSHPQADDFLRRDLKNIVNYFNKQGLSLDKEEVYKQVLSEDN